MKKTYINPSTTVVVLSMADGVLNYVSEYGTATMNPNSMVEGNGSDATKDEGDYDLWDEE